MREPAVRARPLDDSAARAVLAEIEGQLARTAHARFGIPADATVDALCEAYAMLADRCHPRHFDTVASTTKQRAIRCYRALREAFWDLAKDCQSTQSTQSTEGEVDEQRTTQRFRRAR